jgi:hypothetical protein
MADIIPSDEQQWRALNARYDWVTQKESFDEDGEVLSRGSYVNQNGGIPLSIGKVYVVCLVLLSALGGGFLWWEVSREYAPHVYTCGNSTTEATALGCKYDTLASAWLPEPCRDDELTAEFDRAGPGGSWKYYSDENLTTELTLAELALYGDRKEMR